MSGYVGRFAPSPTGLLHAGSVVAALASWLDARAAGGRWLVRIEDVDTPRCMPGAAEAILAQLAALGLHPDELPWWQSRRATSYQTALDRLLAADRAYPCACTRQDIARAMAARGQPHTRDGELVYPGTCRLGLGGRTARAVRLRTLQPDGQDAVVDWMDRQLGPQRQNVTQAVGDVVLKRADGLWAYQLAVVVDDAAQGVTHVVRGEDLADNTPRQILLQRALGVHTPQYLHTPLVRAADGHKLSKQNGARPVDTGDASAVRATLEAAAAVLGLPPARTVPAPGDWLARAVQAWAAGRWHPDAGTSRTKGVDGRQ